MKIKSKDELIKYLLYTNCNNIMVGKKADIDIKDDLTPNFANKIIKLLTSK